MKFECKRCGKCCCPPRLYKQDIKRIEKAEKDFSRLDFRNIPYLKEKSNGKCIFLKESKIAYCRIYQYRPKICRLYPAKLINNSCEPEKLASDKLFEK